MRHSNDVNEDVKALNHLNKRHKLYIISLVNTYSFEWTELLLIILTVNPNQFVVNVKFLEELELYVDGQIVQWWSNFLGRSISFFCRGVFDFVKGQTKVILSHKKYSEGKRSSEK